MTTHRPLVPTRSQVQGSGFTEPSEKFCLPEVPPRVPLALYSQWHPVEPPTVDPLTFIA